ncbi:hypothetical protein NPIL_60431 [Nephila pilipes]|uniref:Uncharacterized protein n=1 Tax=Nephila pilipes TaxID=299642 RepID=A0A8X6TVK6_NEPPI|nr:hypothetical protein NPIL_60431 [Nephila pilipes]
MCKNPAPINDQAGNGIWQSGIERGGHGNSGGRTTRDQQRREEFGIKYFSTKMNLIPRLSRASCGSKSYGRKSKDAILEKRQVLSGLKTNNMVSP